MAKQIPVRQCIGCREMKKKTEMFRIIRTPDNAVCLDKTGRMNGRGAYICPNTECLKTAVRSKALERALNVKIPDDIYETISREMI